MGFVDLFRPKWKHSDAEVRAAAVRELGSDDDNVLVTVARSDSDAGVRRIAIKKLEDPAVLREIAGDDADEGLRQMAHERASAILLGRATGEDQEAARSALAELTDPRAIAEVAKLSPVKELRGAAVERLDDQKALADVARNAKEPGIRVAALQRVTDDSVLRSIALTEERKDAALQALQGLTERADLKAVSRKARNKTVRSAARKRLDELAPARDGGAGARQHGQWDKLCQSAEVLARSADWEATARRFEELHQAWLEVTGTPPAELTERFEGAQKAFFDRYAAHQREQKERAEQEQALQAVLGDHIAICEQIEQLSGDDAPARLEQLEQDWQQLGAIPESHREVVVRRFEQACAACLERHESRQQEQAEQARFEDLWQRARGLAEAERLGRALRTYEELSRDWERLAGRAAPPPELADRFAEVGRRLEERDAESRARREQQRRENHERLESLHDRMVEAMSSDNLKQAERLHREAQAAIKRIGPLPSKQVREELQGRLREARDKLFIRVRELREAEDWKRWANVPKLEALCEEVEALLEEQDLSRAARQLRKAQGAWKKVGPAPKDKSEALWKRFKGTCDKVYERCQDHFAEAEKQRDENLKLKEALCERVEALADSEEFAETAETIKGLQAEWKQVGPVPRAQSNKVWKRFRKACDQFFDRRQDHLDRTSGERQENLARKQELCEQVEALADSEEFAETAETIKGLQAEWKQVGPVPRAESDAVWKRFRGACDRFFDRRQQHMDEQRAANLEHKEALCAELEALADDSCDVPPEERARRVLDARAGWRDLGPVPRSRSDKLWSRFCAACEAVVTVSPEAFKGTDLDPAANLERKRNLCREAEQIADIIDPPRADPRGGAEQPPADSVEQMAEQLRSALAENALRGAETTQAMEWPTASREIKRLQADWKRAGPVPGDEGEAIWRRFRAACDRVFDQRREPDGDKPSAEQTANLEQKQAICEEVEALAAEEQPGQHQERVRELRRQWKAIGPVPRSRARRLWNRFRRACNRVMADAKQRESGEPPSGEPGSSQPAAEAAEGVSQPAEEAEDGASQPAAAVADGAAQPAASVAPGTRAGWDSSLDSGWDDALDAGWDDALGEDDTKGA